MTVYHGYRGIETRGKGPEVRLINSNIEGMSDIGVNFGGTPTGVVFTHCEIGQYHNYGILAKHLGFGHFTSVLVDYIGHKSEGGEGIGSCFYGNSVHGIQLSNCWAGTITGVHGRAYDIRKSRQIIINNCQAETVRRVGIWVEEASSISITNCRTRGYFT